MQIDQLISYHFLSSLFLFLGVFFFCLSGVLFFVFRINKMVFRSHLGKKNGRTGYTTECQVTQRLNSETTTLSENRFDIQRRIILVHTNEVIM